MSYTKISLFDGMSCGQLAIEDMPHLKEGRYFASEVDKYAIQVTQHNYPNTIQIGDVSKLVVKRFKSGLVKLVNEWGKKYYIDGKILLQGGSPCQGFSFAGKQLGSSTKCNIEVTTLEQYLKLKEEGFEFEGQSYLFWEYIRILREIKPDVFLLENVMMSKKWKDMFNDAVGVEPIMINSSLVSVGMRKRCYWTNIKDIVQPKDLKLNMNSILEFGYSPKNKARCLLASDSRPLTTPVKMFHRFYSSGFTNLIFKNERHYKMCVRHYNKNYKNCSASDIDLLNLNNGVYVGVRYYTRNESELNQTVPLNYTNCVPVLNAKHMLGNGWTIDVISYIYSHL